MKIEYKHRMAFGLVLLLLGIAIEIIWKDAYSPLTSRFLAVGIVLIVGSAVKHLKFVEGADRDERTIKLGAFALAYAWLVTFIFMLLLILLDHYLVRLAASTALIFTMAVATLSAEFFRWHFKRKGDTE